MLRSPEAYVLFVLVILNTVAAVALIEKTFHGTAGGQAGGAAPSNELCNSTAADINTTARRYLDTLSKIKLRSNQTGFIRIMAYLGPVLKRYNMSVEGRVEASCRTEPTKCSFINDFLHALIKGLVFAPDYIDEALENVVDNNTPWIYVTLDLSASIYSNSTLTENAFYYLEGDMRDEVVSLRPSVNVISYIFNYAIGFIVVYDILYISDGDNVSFYYNIENFTYRLIVKEYDNDRTILDITPLHIIYYSIGTSSKYFYQYLFMIMKYNEHNNINNTVSLINAVLIDKLAYVFRHYKDKIMIIRYGYSYDYKLLRIRDVNNITLSVFTNYLTSHIDIYWVRVFDEGVELEHPCYGFDNKVFLTFYPFSLQDKAEAVEALRFIQNAAMDVVATVVSLLGVDSIVDGGIP